MSSRQGSMYDFSFSSRAFRLRLRLKKNRPTRSEMKTIPPITPPTIAPVLAFLSLVVEELGEELDEVPDGKPVEVFDAEDGASC